jgi:RNA polymerase sigma-70 factor (ECF subfamily)
MNSELSGIGDEELARRAQNGDARAFEEIYDRHAAGVARALASFAGPDRDLLDDLTQDVFFRVVKALASYTPNHPFSHWLYTIALNVGRNHARRKAVVIPVNPAVLDDVAGESALEPLGVEQSTAEELMRLVAELPVQMREVISLRIGSDFSYQEIAELLGIPVGTARSRMHNAVKLLREKSGISRRLRRRQNE